MRLDFSIEQDIGRLLLDRKMTLAVAESCTGGLLGSRITSVAGSSRYFLGGVICYSNESKIRLLGVDPAVLERAGAVSEETVRQMAEGARRGFGAHAGIGITGIAGPGGGTPGKPVGTVFVGLSAGKDWLVRASVFAGDRGSVRRQSCDVALGMLKEWLVEQGVPHG